ncbi:MAG TPA: YbaK/EbsC family protein [Jatrophihabitans sp.]|nr:YbaK/EbsC family protein [Jatrophihabitans sp.]
MALTGELDPAAARVKLELAARGATGVFRVLDSAVPTARAAAEALSCELGAIANSLVFSSDDQPLLVLASGAHRVDLALLAERLGLGTLRRADPDFVLRVTGQPVGGVAPIGHPCPLPTVIDQDLFDFSVIWAGGGSKDAMFATSAAELVRLTGARSMVVR